MRSSVSVGFAVTMTIFGVMIGIMLHQGFRARQGLDQSAHEVRGKLVERVREHGSERRLSLLKERAQQLFREANAKGRVSMPGFHTWQAEIQTKIVALEDHQRVFRAIVLAWTEQKPSDVTVDMIVQDDIGKLLTLVSEVQSSCWSSTTTYSHDVDDGLDEKFAECILRIDGELCRAADSMLK